MPSGFIQGNFTPPPPHPPSQNKSLKSPPRLGLRNVNYKKGVVFIREMSVFGEEWKRKQLEVSEKIIILFIHCYNSFDDCVKKWYMNIKHRFVNLRVSFSSFLGNYKWSWGDKIKSIGKWWHILYSVVKPVLLSLIQLGRASNFIWLK